MNVMTGSVPGEHSDTSGAPAQRKQRHDARVRWKKSKLNIIMFISDCKHAVICRLTQISDCKGVFL